MTQMVFPSNTWNKTVNYIDTLLMEYNTTYPSVSLSLHCETAVGTNTWWNWGLPGPLPSDGTFNLHLATYNFQKYLNVFPTDCHFEIINAKDTQTKINAGLFQVTTANRPETTWGRTITATSVTGASASTLAAATSVSKVTTSSPASGAPNNTGTAAATSTSIADSSADSTSLNASARIGIGIGVGLGGVLLIVLAWFALVIYRKRKWNRYTPVPPTNANSKHEKAELLGTPVLTPQRSSVILNSLGSPGKPDQHGYSDFSAVDHRHKWDPPIELPTRDTHNHHPIHELQPGQRFELGA